MSKYLLGVMLVVSVFVGTGCGCWQSGQAGQVGVIRNGGPIDNTNIRGLLAPNAGNTEIGYASTVHFYPADFVQRYYTISADGSGDRAGVDVVRVQTADGFEVGIEATIYFNTAFTVAGEGAGLVKDFDTNYGQRTFPVRGESSTKHPYEGDKGWSAFLDTVFRPVIDNELRTEISRVRCEELIASCALVATQGKINLNQVGDNENSVNIQRIQDAINAGLEDDLTSTLKKPYFKNITFRLSRVTLSSEVQSAINQAQAAFAQVAQAQAKVEQASKTAEANAKLAEQYKKYPVLAQIEMIKNLPSGANVYFGVTPTVIAK